MRLVRAPSGEVVADLAGSLPGRGCYCCLQRNCLAGVTNLGLLSHTFRTRMAPIDRDLFVTDLHHQASQRLAGAIGVYAKGGAVVAGSDAIDLAMAKASTVSGLLVVATDAGDATARHWRHRAATAGLAVHTAGRESMWGAALGRDRCAVLWVCAPRAAKRVEWLLTLAAETAPIHTT
ncbi:MAG: hypothetical protein AUK30_06370 [Nitrospirae bacterium CG2_30_70_394]|nr:MAG: hypothetical protein AUK30_06370 [Nitrospirae bacterium CG2_30_70_394]